MKFFGTVGNVLVAVGVSYGMGNHMTVIVETGGVESAEKALMWFWIGAFFAVLSLGISKVAACVFLVEVQSRRHRTGRWFLYFVAASNVRG